LQGRNMKTFDDLQVSFPLFKAPVAHADVDDPGNCICCGSSAEIRFHGACYNCFRADKVDTVIDTEFGMVTLECAQAGHTHGIPLSNPSTLAGYQLTQHPIDPRFPDDLWYHVHIDSECLFELLCTPKYLSWQGDRWFFCCHRPMIFRGSLPADILPHNTVKLSSAIAAFLAAPDWTRTVGDDRRSYVYYYAFTCAVCGALRYYDDCD
jgi:uncharacterized protein CbrC (UPF0167 family)